MFSLKRKNIKIPLKTDCAREIKKNGVKIVPEKIDEQTDFKTVRMKNEKKFSENALKITMFESPNFKNGMIFGIKSSAYEKISESAVKYAIFSDSSFVILLRDSIKFSVFFYCNDNFIREADDWCGKFLIYAVFSFAGGIRDSHFFILNLKSRVPNRSRNRVNSVFFK